MIFLADREKSCMAGTVPGPSAAVPPTSANVERGFSHARKLVDPLRASMTPAHIEMWLMNKIRLLC